jgi:diguanylate cyclase (GGDEF)-like protein
VVLAVFALAELLLVHFEFRGQSQALTLGEIPLLVGLVFCAPPGLLAARLGASLLVLGLVVRQSRVKLGFNLAMHATKALAALAVYHAALGGASPISARGWAAAFIAAATADLVSHLSIIVVITLTAGLPPRDSVVPLVVTCAVAAATNTSLALLAVVVVWHQVTATWLLVVVAAVYATGYRAHTTIRRRYANLTQLYRFTSAVSGVVVETEVIRAVLRESRDLLGAERAELAVVTGSAVQRYTLVGDEVHSEFATRPSALEATVLRTGASTVVSRRPRDGASQHLLDDAGARDLIAAPVNSGADVTAVLMVADRASEVSTFDADDCRLFETLANHAAVALHGGQLLERLRDEVAAKEYQSLHDPLTGLANRSLFATRVNECVEESGAGVAAVMLMDLDRFKEINDTLGHHTGDVVLTEIADRLVRLVAGRGTVARLGGDEFAVVWHRVDNAGVAIALAQDLRRAAVSAVAVDDMVLEVQASVGIALSPEHGTDAASLLQRADVAMYDAKNTNHGVVVYAADKDQYTPRRLALVGELRAALANDGLELYYQPQVNMADRTVCGAEALLRWNHPEHGFIAPDEFIPIAEHSGLMAPLTSWVMETALTQLAKWRSQGSDLAIAVNMSARSMADPGLVDEIQALLVKTGVPADRLVLELTETSVMTDLAQGLDILQRLDATGAHLSIDDFGTGYSSLARLARLPVHEVKIDRSFVMGLAADDGSNAVIVRSTIDLARNLGLRVVAEGVEDLAAWDMLAALRCDAAQGFFLTRPLPAAAFEEWVASWERLAPVAWAQPRTQLHLVPASA